MKLTNQEAIDLLNDRIGHLIASDPGYAERYSEACRMGVEALKVVEALEAMMSDKTSILEIRWIDKKVIVDWWRGSLHRYDKSEPADTLAAAILDAREKL